MALPVANAEKNAASCISLPMFPELTQEEVDYTIQVVRGLEEVARSMSTTYTVAVAGLGKRGVHHADAVSKNARFKLVGLCDIDQARLDDAKKKFGVAYGSTDAAQMLRDVKPDVFVFCTLPQIRLPLIKAGVEAKVKLIAYEKPVATSMSEAIEMRKLTQAAGVKTVVSHQHRYGQHYEKVKEIIASGAIGRVHTVYGTPSAG